MDGRVSGPESCRNSCALTAKKHNKKITNCMIRKCDSFLPGGSSC